MRLAACDVQHEALPAGADPLKGQIAGPYADEATFHYLPAARQGERAEYQRQARIFADRAGRAPVPRKP